MPPFTVIVPYQQSPEHRVEAFKGHGLIQVNVEKLLIAGSDLCSHCDLYESLIASGGDTANITVVR